MKSTVDLSALRFVEEERFIRATLYLGNSLRDELRSVHLFARVSCDVEGENNTTRPKFAMRWAEVPSAKCSLCVLPASGASVRSMEAGTALRCDFILRRMSECFR